MLTTKDIQEFFERFKLEPLIENSYCCHYIIKENNETVGLKFSYKINAYDLRTISPNIHSVWILFKDYPFDTMIDLLQTFVGGCDEMEKDGVWDYLVEVFVNGERRYYEDVGEGFIYPEIEPYYEGE